MTGDRSLEEFASAGSPAGDAEATTDREGAEDADADAAAAGADAGAVDAGPDAVDVDSTDDEDLIVEPIGATHAWSPDGADCAACGETVIRRWRAGDETVAADVTDDRADLVCDDCKVW